MCLFSLTTMTTGSSHHDSSNVWSKQKELHPQYEGKPVRADLIACCPNGDLVISDVSKLYLLAPDGICRLQMTSPERDNEKQLGYVSGIAVSPAGHLFVVDNSRYEFSPFLIYMHTALCVHCLYKYISGYHWLFLSIPKAHIVFTCKTIFNMHGRLLSVNLWISSVLATV